MTRKRQRQCHPCSEPPYLGGFCREHYAEDIEKERVRDAALKALHSGVVGDRQPDHPALREELSRLREWWYRARSSVISGTRDEVLLDEAKYAMDWCIALGQEIVQAEEAIRHGRSVGYSLEHTSEWVWERFSNLEAGLMSNGVKRPSE